MERNKEILGCIREALQGKMPTQFETEEDSHESSDIDGSSSDSDNSLY
jgi:hypothetical protein